MFLLAWARFAFRPVGCGANLGVSPFTPKRTEGAGPVCCGRSGAGAGGPVCCGMNGAGAGGPGKPDTPVLWGSRAGGRSEFMPPAIGADENDCW